MMANKGVLPTSLYPTIVSRDKSGEESDLLSCLSRQIHGRGMPTVRQRQVSRTAWTAVEIGQMVLLYLREKWKQGRTPISAPRQAVGLMTSGIRVRLNDFILRAWQIDAIVADPFLRGVSPIQERELGILSCPTIPRSFNRLPGQSPAS